MVSGRSTRLSSICHNQKVNMSIFSQEYVGSLAPVPELIISSLVFISGSIFGWLVKSGQP